MSFLRVALRVLKRVSIQSSHRRAWAACCRNRLENLEARLLLTATVLVDEDFEDGTAEQFDYIPTENDGIGSSALVVNGLSHDTGQSAYAITYARDEYGANLEKYFAQQYDALDVEFSTRLPDGIPVDNTGIGYAGLKLSRVTRTSGLPSNHNLQIQLDYLREGYNGPNSEADYSVYFYHEHDDQLLRVPLNFSTDQWFRIRYLAKMNTPGQSDGALTVWLDGVQSGHLSGLTYSDSIADRPDGMWVGGNFSYHGVDPETPFRRMIDNVKVTLHTDDHLATLDANGTTGPDTFVLTYSGDASDSTVNVSVSSGGAAARNLGTFPMSTVLNLNGLGGTDSVRIVGSTLDDTLEVSTAGLLINGSRILLNSIESRTLAGAAGSDVYRFDADTALGLWALDEAGGGIDTVDFSLTTTVGLSMNMAYGGTQAVHRTNLSLSLGSGATFENATGGSGADNLIGNSLNNTLRGGPGVDTLNGARGSDSLFGGANNDTYLFGASSVPEADQVTETVNDGIDTLNFAYLTTNVWLHLGANSVQAVHANRTLKLNSPITLENAVGGSGADTLIGNSLNNTLVGNAGTDTLNGSSGSDFLLGGANNDTYLFGPASVAEADQVTENLNDGTDTLNFAYLTTSSVVNLGANSTQPVHLNRTLKLNSPITFENFTGGSASDTLTGNSLSNTLIGGPGDDTLNGAAGSDLLIGGANNDTYLFGAATAAEADHVTENPNEGIDLLNFAYLTTDVVLNLGSLSIQPVHLNRTLKLNSVSTIENAMGGAGHDTLLGNVLANRLTGGNGNNILVGLEGGDILVSGTGRDTLIGGLGLDILNGGTGEDILIAGRTTNDTSLTSLNTLRTAWISAAPYAARITNLRAGVGNPLVSLKATINVLNDGGEADVMTGGTDTDWFFRALDDVITDLVAGEILDLL